MHLVLNIMDAKYFYISILTIDFVLYMCKRIWGLISAMINGHFFFFFFSPVLSGQENLSFFKMYAHIVLYAVVS